MQLCVFCDLREVWKSTNLIKWEQSTNFFQKFLWFSQFNKLQHNIWEKTLTSALYLQVQPNPQQSSLHICSVNLKFFFFFVESQTLNSKFFFPIISRLQILLFYTVHVTSNNTGTYNSYELHAPHWPQLIPTFEQ